MKRLLWCVLTPLCVFQAWGTYVYSTYPNALNPYDSTKWTINGSVSAANNSLRSSTSGSLVYNGSAGTNYEVRTVITLTNGVSGGYFATYLRATANSQMGTSNGTYYAIEFQNPTFANGGCSATLAAVKVISGVMTVLTNTSVPCHAGNAELRVVYNNSSIIAYLDGLFYILYTETSIGSGQPGVGVRSAPSGNAITAIDIGPADTVAPAAVLTQNISASSFPNRVDLRWEGAADNAGGTGIAWYQIARQPQGGSYTWLANLNNFTTYQDSTVAASTSYTYTITAIDYHLNYSTASFTVDTSPAGSVDPRQVGVRPLGSYWGGGGEQIDTRSGNVNYTIPLLKAMGRNGWSVGFSLSYNSQNWRQDSPSGQPAATWQFGRDIGYGYGWRLQAGSLTPVYTDYWTIHHWQFIDSTGAEYRLDTVNNNDPSGHPVWTSSEGVYLFYDATAARLYFKDGSFWVFGCMSAGTEQDTGTMYPTLMENPNGNTISLSYDTGAGANWPNSSGRILSIGDVRGSYTFAYNTDTPVKHLQSITNNFQSSESYAFQCLPGALTSPFNSNNQYGPVNYLQYALNSNTSLKTQFGYDSSGALSKVTFPYSGYLRWSYTVASTLVGNRTQNELAGRYLSATGNSADEKVYGLYRDPNADLNSTFHTFGQIVDYSGNADKVWLFQNNTSQPYAGLQTEYMERQFSPLQALRDVVYTWSSDGSPSNSAYVSNALTSNYWWVNNSMSQIQSLTSQTLDKYGNLLTQKIYNYGAVGGGVGSLARTYTNTYLTSNVIGNYEAKFIRNRLLTSTVTDGTNSATLASISYDGYNGACGALTPAPTSPAPTAYDTSYTTSVIARGNPNNIEAPGSSSCTNYDATGNVTSSSVNGVSTAVAMDSNRNYAVPSTLTTNTLSASMSWTSALGLSSETGPNGDVASIVYDATARPTSTTSPFGAVMGYTYNDSANNRFALTNGHGTKTTVDGFGRTIKVETGSGTTSNFTVTGVVETQYAPCGCSPLGKVSQVSQPHAPGGTVVWTVYTYDALGRTTKVTMPDGNSFTSYLYQGNTVKVTDPAGNAKTYTMDALGNLVSVAETDPNLGSVTTSYTYDVLNHLKQVSMPRGGVTQTRTFNYNTGTTVGAYLLSATNPENGTVYYSYNSNGTLAGKTDAKGTVFTYQYDTYNRLVSLKANGNTLRTYTYDTNAPFSQYAAGRLASVSYSAGAGQFVEMYSYIQAGGVAIKRLQVNETLHYGGTGTTTSTLNLDASYSYDNEGRVTSMTYPNAYPVNSSGTGVDTVAGPTYGYSYDALGRPAGMTSGSNTLVSGLQYGPANELQSMTYYGATETRGYNALLQLTSISGPVSVQYAYSTTQNNGKILSQTDAISGEQVLYTYDSLNRLLKACNPGVSGQDPCTTGSGWGTQYTYDGFGNLTAKTTKKGSAPGLSVSVDATTNRISGSYDANGNMTQAGSNVYSYDLENRLAWTGPWPTAAIYYGYDGQNKRIWQSNGVTDANGNLLSQQLNFYGIDGKKLAVYTLQVQQAGANAVPFLSSVTPEVDTYFGGRRVGVNGVAFGQDRLGSQGGPSHYYPYGEDKGTPLANDQVKFATYTRDGVSGLDYADQRYYSSQWGRFMTPDPYRASGYLSDSQSWNRYSYTRSDPVNRYDRSGLCDQSDDTDTSVTVCGDDDEDNSDIAFQPAQGLPTNPRKLAPLQITKLAKSGKKYDQVKATFDKVLSAIDPDCLSFLQSGGQKLPAYVGDLLDNQLLAVGNFSVSSYAAITSTFGTNLYPGDAAIVVNNNGAFFNSYYSVDQGKIQGGTALAQAFIVLHELAHALDAKNFQSDGPTATNKQAGAQNDKLIDTQCQNTLKRF